MSTGKGTVWNSAELILTPLTSNHTSRSTLFTAFSMFSWLKQLAHTCNCNQQYHKSVFCHNPHPREKSERSKWNLKAEAGQNPSAQKVNFWDGHLGPENITSLSKAIGRTLASSSHFEMGQGGTWLRSYLQVQAFSAGLRWFPKWTALFKGWKVPAGGLPRNEIEWHLTWPRHKNDFFLQYYIIFYISLYCHCTHLYYILMWFVIS